MRYQSFSFQEFGGGLNLRDKVDTVAPDQAIDALNVRFTERGAIQPRYGYEEATASELTNRAESLSPFYQGTETRQLLAGCGTRLEALNNKFEVIQSATGLKKGPWTFARVGQPNAEVAYTGNGEDTLRKWDGEAWSVPTATVNGEEGKAMPKGKYLCVQPSYNRLVVAGFETQSGGPNGAESSPSHVYFSEPGNPEGYESTAYVQLTPGDGERITGICAWREMVFVFKESQFFVFYGNSVDEEEGTPIFNYRSVTTGTGLAAPRSLCVDRTGVYFVDHTGVYRTTGQEPELVSSLIEPIFTGNPSSFYTGGILKQAQITECCAFFWENRLYLSFPVETVNTRTLTYSPLYGWWSLTDLPCAAITIFDAGQRDEMIFAASSGAKKLYKRFPTYTNDAGAGFKQFWRQGWFDLENPDVKKIRATKIWGSGKVSMGMQHDFKQSVGTLNLIDMESEVVDEWGGTEWGEGEWAVPSGLIGAERRVSIRGTAFSTYFQNETKDQEWSVHRLEELVPNVRDPAVVTA